MAEKTAGKSAGKNPAMSIKEKRAQKRAGAATTTSVDKAAATKKK
ncbi:hypothetical protein [Arthrobacter sp. H14-L1]|nr:hypothetical protein [Arthrobacter sp. H14-L1]MCY0906517.1 hypothetical protein [Arthrobacter sp. H14-L1]